MGSKPVPHYANIFMTNIYKKIEALALPKIFLDDFILLYFRPSRKLHVLFDKKNKKKHAHNNQVHNESHYKG